jgi:hypothetical protein
LLVFTHIPRTGGTSLRYFISERVKRSKYVDGFTDFAFMSDDELNNNDFLATHCGYGIFSRLKNESEKIIVLREPVERVISTYYHLRELPQYVSYASHYAKTMSVEDFVMESNPAVSISVENTQMWHLIQDKNLPFRQRYADVDNEKKIEMALENLTKYTFVGFYDQLDSLLSKVCTHYSWPLEEIPWLAKSSKPAMNEVQLPVIEKIAAKTSLDVILYREARRRYAAPHP